MKIMWCWLVFSNDVLYFLSHQFNFNFKPKNLSKKWVNFIQYYKWNNYIKKHVFVDYSILVKKFEEEMNNPLKIKKKT
jgi:hypothetical protein